ncbi:MAG: hypothetical protein ACOC9Q_01955 [bacterium]
MTCSAGRSPAQEQPSAQRQWSGQTRGGVVGNGIFVWLLRTLGLRAAYLLLYPVALYYLVVVGQARRASADYRRRIGMSRDGWVGSMVEGYRHFLTFGKLLLDRIAMIAGPADKFHVRFEGEQYLRESLEQGRGLVLVSAHVGNWQGAANLLRRLGRRVHVVTYEKEAERVRRFFDSVCKDRRFSVISSDGTSDCSLAILSALRRGEVVAMHADRCLETEGQCVEFLGGLARFPAGPFIAAAVAQAPLIPVFAFREGTYRYRFVADPPQQLHLPRGRRRDEELRKVVEQFARRVEEMLRQYPLQWLNFYDFWRSGQAECEQVACK